MAITHVGTFAQNGGTSVTTVAITTVNLGDIVILTDATSSATSAATAVSGGGVTTWTQVGTTLTLNSTVVSQVTMWRGVVTSIVTGSTVTVTRSGTPGSTQIDADQFTAGLGSTTVWGVDKAGSVAATTASTWTGPSLTPTSTALSVGYAVTSGSSSGTNGTPAGYVYNTDTTFGATRYYNLNVSAATAGAGANSGQYGAIGALLTASAGTVTATATLAGSGSLSAAPTLTLPATATLAGVGTVSATSSTATTATLTGSGSVTASPTVLLNAIASLAGAGSLSASPIAGMTALLAGTGSLTGTAVDITQNATVALAGAGALGAADTQTVFPTALLAGTGSITAATAGSVYVPYVPEGWTDNSLATPVSAARMNYMEAGMVQIDQAQQGRAPLLVATLPQTSAYSAAANDLVPVNLSGSSVAVTLPSAPADKTQIAVQVSSTGTGNTCSVLTGGVDVFDRIGGGGTKTLSLLGEFVVLEYKASGAIWYSIASGAPRASLDARYVQTVTAADGTVTVAGTASAPTVAVNAIPESKVTNLTSDLSTLTTNVAAKVASVTAADSTVTVAGTSTAPTVKVNAIAESQVTNLTTDLAAKAPLASPTFTGTVTVPHVVASGTAPTIAAGANNGTTPPAPTVTGNDTRGTVSFGSGTSPAIGAQIVVTFASAFAVAPTVQFTATKSALQSLGPYVSATTTTTFTLSTVTAPAASQAATVYAGAYIAVG